MKASFGTKRSQVQILSPRPEKAGSRKVSGSFFVSFAQSAVFGAFFMQRMCNLGERAKDTVPIGRLIWLILGARGQKVAGLIVYEHRIVAEILNMFAL